MADDYTSVWCSIVDETEKGVKIKTEDEEMVWLPKSQIKDVPQVRMEGQAVLLEVKVWLAEEKGLV